MRSRVEISGVVRKLDELGRIVIPREFRRVHNIENGDAVEIFNTNKGILVRKDTIENELLSCLDLVLDKSMDKRLDSKQLEELETRVEKIKEILDEQEIDWE